jgi:S1-C subfamily serine protease
MTHLAIFLVAACRCMASGAGDRAAQDMAIQAVVCVKTENFDFASARERTLKGTGTGFLIGRDGHILTNYHVISDSKSIQVSHYDGVSAPASVVAIDPLIDIAILQINSDLDAPKRPFYNLAHNVAPRRGAPVVYTGFPLEYGWTTCRGHISSPSRLLEPGNIVNHIQIDGNAATGMSGAPVTTADGRLVGMLARNALGCDTIGFVIPADVCLEFHQRFLLLRETAYGWAGASLQHERKANVAFYRIAHVAKNSPAHEQGLRQGQVVLAIDGKRPPAGPAAWNQPFYLAGRDSSFTLTIADSPGAPTREVTVRPKIFTHVFPDKLLLAQRGLACRRFSPYETLSETCFNEPTWAVERVIDQSRAGDATAGAVVSATDIATMLERLAP